jgi:2-polyprenyl-6-methoxyphenol hydroxylase-like FAD-dependent oxidoreductase
MVGKTSVIFGGGVGGLVTANELRKRLGKEHRVALVDRAGIYSGRLSCGFK